MPSPLCQISTYSTPQAMDSPAGSAFLDNAWKVVEDFIKSDNGKRFMKLVCNFFQKYNVYRVMVNCFSTVRSQVPGLMAAKDMDETLALLSKEAEVLQPHSTRFHEL